jgi:hypothetical protein
VYIKGNLRDDFLGGGIKFDPFSFALMANNVDFAVDHKANKDWVKGLEDKAGERKKTKKRKKAPTMGETVQKKKKSNVFRSVPEKLSPEPDPNTVEPINLEEVDPTTDDDDGGTHQYGLGVKPVDEVKKKKNEKDKKDRKEKGARVGNDILSQDEREDIRPAQRKSKAVENKKGKAKKSTPKLAKPQTQKSAKRKIPRPQTVATPVLGRNFRRNKYV